MRLLTRPETLLKKRLDSELEQRGKLSEPDKILFDAIAKLQDQEARLKDRRAEMEALAAQGHLSRFDQSKLDRLEQFAANQPLDLAATVSERLAKVERFTNISGEEILGNFENWHKAQLDKFKNTAGKPENNEEPKAKRTKTHRPLQIEPRAELKRTGTYG